MNLFVLKKFLTINNKIYIHQLKINFIESALYRFDRYPTRAYSSLPRVCRLIKINTLDNTIICSDHDSIRDIYIFYLFIKYINYFY